MSGDKINVINQDYYASGWNRVKVRNFDTSAANILLMILPLPNEINLFLYYRVFPEARDGYPEAGCYDMASCFLSEERFECGTPE